MADSSDEDSDSADSPDSEIADMFECSEPGCVKSFQTFWELESPLFEGREADRSTP